MIRRKRGMDIKDFKAGQYKKGFEYNYFVPSLINHAFYWTNSLISELLEKASLKLGELNSFARLVPDVDMFIKIAVYKEAVVSSKIEGTRTNIKDALTDKR
jgi:Fic family protein